MNRLLILILLVAIAACSNRSVYENIQIHQRNKCMKQPSGPYEECLERVNPPYEDYQRERKKVLEEQSGRTPAGVENISFRQGTLDNLAMTGPAAAAGELARK